MARPVKISLDFENIAKILNLPDPATAQEPATRAYVDAAVEGLAWKDSARVATQANLGLASPGATIDGIAMVANDRVLVRSQTTQSENGIYIWNGAAVAMTRTADSSTFPELEQAVVTVEEGTSAGATFRQTTVNGTLGSSNVVWASFGTSAPSATETTAGIAEIATQAETDTGTDDLRFVTPLKLATQASRFRRFAATFGDGTATQYDLTHNFNSTDVQVGVYRVSDGKEVLVEISRFSANVVRINTESAVALNALRCVVQY
jgi:hypothetical protein